MQNWYLGSDKKKRNVNNGFKVVNLNHLKKKKSEGHRKEDDKFTFRQQEFETTQENPPKDKPVDMDWLPIMTTAEILLIEEVCGSQPPRWLPAIPMLVLSPPTSY